MLKKLLAILMAGAMMASFAACGSKGADSAAGKDVSASDDGAEDAAAKDTAAAGDDVAAYEEGMSSIVTSYEALLDELNKLLGSYDGSEEWWTSYKAVYDASSEITDQVATLADITPEEYADSYSSIVVAMAAYTDGMDALATGIDSTDADAQQEAFDSAVALFESAGELWTSAVETVNVEG